MRLRETKEEERTPKSQGPLSSLGSLLGRTTREVEDSGLDFCYSKLAWV